MTDKKTTTISVLLTAFAISAEAIAQDATSVFMKCGTHKNEKERLLCYDATRDKVTELNNTAKTGQPQYIHIGLDDLKTDIKKLSGKKVETTGKLKVFVDLKMIYLSTDEFDMTPVMMYGENLPRDDRKKLLTSCQMISCKATVSGTIKPGMAGHQIFADRVIWQ